MSLTPRYRAARKNVEHLVERTAHHEMTGDLIAASVFAARLVHALDHLVEYETHVIVGDHTPERRAVMLPVMLPAKSKPRLHNPRKPYDHNLNPG